jgi:hypothetical protein
MENFTPRLLLLNLLECLNSTLFVYITPVTTLLILISAVYLRYFVKDTNVFYSFLLSQKDISEGKRDQLSVKTPSI